MMGARWRVKNIYENKILLITHYSVIDIDITVCCNFKIISTFMY